MLAFRPLATASKNLIKVNMAVPVKAFCTYKTQTGLAGLQVDPNGRQNLLYVTEELLDKIKTLPADVEYRVSLEKWGTYIKKLCGEAKDIKEIEDSLAIGQIEEVIVFVKDELKLVDYFVENKVADRIANAKLTGQDLVNSLSDQLYFNSPDARKKPVPPQQPAK